MGEAASIIIGFTPFHLIAIRKLMPLMDGDIHVSHPHAEMLGSLSKRAHVEFLGGCDAPRRTRWAKTFLAGRDINALVRRSGPVDLYLPHPLNPLGNHAFFHDGVRNRYIYQDGILNYYDAVARLDTRAARLRQRMKGFAVGVRYRMYGGNLSGIDAMPVAGGFFTHPDRVVGADKFGSLRRLDLHDGSADAAGPERSGVLFLDQPIDGAVGGARAREVRKRTVDYTNSLGERVFYKPHYTQMRARPGDRTWLQLDQGLRALPAETVAAKLRVAHVVSFCSSALVNIGLSDNSIGCHATAAQLFPVSVDGRPTNLGEVLSGLGVKVIDALDA